MLRTIGLAIVALGGGQAPPALAQSDKALVRAVQEQGPVVETVRAFVAAQHDFDLARITALTTDDYVEISPLGEVDPRDRMLGFYAPEKKIAGPDIRMGDATVRMIGDRAAIIVTSVSYDIAPTGQPLRTVSLRAVFVARRIGSSWKLASAQYTPIRAKT